MDALLHEFKSVFARQRVRRGVYARASACKRFGEDRRGKRGCAGARIGKVFHVLLSAKRAYRDAICRHGGLYVSGGSGQESEKAVLGSEKLFELMAKKVKSHLS